MSENQLVEIINESGLEKSQAEPLINKFGNFYTDAIKLTVQSKGIVIKDISQVDEMKKSRDFRLKLKKIRTDADKIRIEMKEPFLRGANAVQSAYNGIEKITKEEEKRLEEQEKYIERLEEKRIKDLEQKRIELLSKYCENIYVYSNLGQLSEESFNELIRVNKLAYEAKIKAEKEAEEERLKLQAKENLFNERKLKIAPYQFFITSSEIKLTIDTTEEEFNQLLKTLVQTKKEFDAHLEEEQKEKQKLADEKAKADEARIKAEEELKKQQDAIAEQKRKEEAEKKTQEELEARAKKLAEEAEKKALQAPDKEKLLKVATELSIFQFPILNSEEAKIIKHDAIMALSRVVDLIRERANKL